MKNKNCGLFPTVDKKHLQAGIDQERREEIKKQEIANIMNNVGVMLFHMLYWAALIIGLLNF
jgi:hypothetical protein